MSRLLIPLPLQHGLGLGPCRGCGLRWHRCISHDAEAAEMLLICLDLPGNLAAQIRDAVRSG